MESLHKGQRSRGKSDASNLSVGGSGPGNGGAGADGNAYDTTNLDKEQGNVLMSIISQCKYPTSNGDGPTWKGHGLTTVRPGMDLSKIALPTFVLEPRSLLERITDFFSHPELIFG